MCLTTESSLQPQVLYILIYSVPSHERNKWDCFKYFHMIFPVKGGSSNSYRMLTTSWFVSLKETFPGPQSQNPWYDIGSSVRLSLSVPHWIVGQSCSLDPLCNKHEFVSLLNNIVNEQCSVWYRILTSLEIECYLCQISVI